MVQLAVGIDGSGATQGSATVKKALDDMKNSASMATIEFTKTTSGFSKLLQGGANAVNTFKQVSSTLLDFKNILSELVIVELVKSMAEAVGVTESLNEKFAALSPTAQGAGQNLEYAEEISKTLGLSFVTTAGSLAKFIGAAETSGLTAEQISTTFEGVQVAIKAVGGSSNDAASLIDVLSTGLTRGTVNVRSLQQVFQLVPGSVDLFAKALGVTVSQLQIMEAKGQITAQQLALFGAALKTTYSDQAIKNSADLASNTNRLGNAFHELLSSVGQTGGILDTVIGNVAHKLSDVANAINTLSNDKVKSLTAQIKGIQDLPFGIGNLKVYQDRIAVLQGQLDKLRGSAPGSAAAEAGKLPPLSVTTNPNANALSENQAAAVVNLSESIKQQIAVLDAQAAAGNKAQEATALLGAKSALAKVGIDLLTSANPEVQKLNGLLQGLGPALAAAASSQLATSLKDQTQVLRTQVLAGNNSAAALIRLSATQTLAKQGVDALTPAVAAQVSALIAATKAQQAYNITKGVTEQVGALNAQTVAGRSASQALALYNLQLQFAHAGLNPLSKDVQLLADKLNTATSAQNADKLLQSLTDEAAALALQAGDVIHGKDAVDAYNFAVKAQADGIDLVTTGLGKLYLANKAQQDVGYIAQLEDEVRLAGLNTQQMAIETATRKLSVGATDEQKQAVAQLVLQQQAASETTKFIEQQNKEFAQGIETDLETFLINPATTGFKGLALSFAQTIQKMEAQALAAQAIKALFGALGGLPAGLGGGAGGFFSTAAAGIAGAKAGGGPVSAGSNYLVGEKGPEVLNTNTPGTIIPNHALGGGGGPAPTVNVSPQIVVVQDPTAIPTALRGAQGQSAIVDAITSNRTKIKQLLK